MKKKLTPSQRAMLLRIANKARTKLGKRPVTRLLRGTPGEPGCCVLANTIGYGVSVDYRTRTASLNAGVVLIELDGDIPDDYMESDLIVKNKTATDILFDFDQGHYPELIRR